MTAFYQILSNTPRRVHNKKDGATGCRPKSRDDQFEAAGFQFLAPPSKWLYTWPGDFPVFTVAPGTAGDPPLPGIIARCDRVDLTCYFAYGTDPLEIKRVLDGEIENIKFTEALLFDDCEIDF